jgi:hypothetical protein
MRGLPSLSLHAYACGYCHGTGSVEDGGEVYRCSACNGDGWRVVKRASRRDVGATPLRGYGP